MLHRAPWPPHGGPCLPHRAPCPSTWPLAHPQGPSPTPQSPHPVPPRSLLTLRVSMALLRAQSRAVCSSSRAAELRAAGPGVSGAGAAPRRREVPPARSSRPATHRHRQSTDTGRAPAPVPVTRGGVWGLPAGMRLSHSGPREQLQPPYVTWCPPPWGWAPHGHTRALDAAWGSQVSASTPGSGNGLGWKGPQSSPGSDRAAPAALAQDLPDLACFMSTTLALALIW